MDRRNVFLVRALCAAAVLATGGIAQAGSLEPPAGPVSPTMKTLDQVEARKPIHQSDLPLAISVDGSYYLAENLRANQNGVDMITVIANNVSIDLNGFTIDGTGQGAVASDCIQIEQDVRTFSLTNGAIRGCGQNGVVTNVPFGLTFTVDRVQANQNGGAGMSFGPGSFGVISRSVAKSNVGRGFLVSEGILTDCAAFANGSAGIQVVYGTINGCMARSNGINVVLSSGGTVADTYAP